MSAVGAKLSLVENHWCRPVLFDKVTTRHPWLLNVNLNYLKLKISQGAWLAQLEKCAALDHEFNMVGQQITKKVNFKNKK